MATKLKSKFHSNYVKLFLFMMITITFVVFVMQGINIVGSNSLMSIFESDYFTSENYERVMNDYYYNINRLSRVYKNEENIRAGNLLDRDYINNELELKRESFEFENKDENKVFDEEEEILKIENRLIGKQVNNYQELKKELLEDSSNMKFYTTNGLDEYSNFSYKSKEDIKKLPSYLLVDQLSTEKYPLIEREDNFPWNNRRDFILYWETTLGEGEEIYFGLTDSFVNSEIEKWEEMKKEARDNFEKLLISLILGLIFFILYSIIIGRNYFGDREINMTFIDRFYSELNVLILCLLVLVWGSLLFSKININRNMTILLTLVFSSLGLVFVTAIIKNIKNRSFIKNSLIYKIFAGIFSYFKSLYNSSSLGKKVILIVLIYPVATVLSLVLFPLVMAFAIWKSLRETRRFEEIQKGVVAIKDGDVNHKIEIGEKGELGRLASDINDIADGLSLAVEGEIKSQKMKTELITNVSHDIRTPLTSIITYIDLLKIEEDEEKRSEYIDILENKSQRLKTLIDDLFEASKLTSGDIPVEMANIDLVALISQGLGELGEEIEENQLDFKLSYDENKDYIVLADGNLLWRSMENLLSNIFKYALENSRVYIDLVDGEDSVEIIIKNISAYELNISEEELMERFKRGDASRTSEGSGLGLSIAKDLIDVQNGDFKIEIDGDLFKTIIQLKKSK